MNDTSGATEGAVVRRRTAAQLTLATGEPLERQRAVEAARSWFLRCSAELLGDPGRNCLAHSEEWPDWFSDEPLTWHAGLHTWESDADFAPGEWTKTFRPETWPEFLGRVEHLPRGASLEIERSDEDGRRSAESVSVSMVTEPGWMTLSVDLADDVVATAQGRRQVLTTIREIAEWSAPTSGSVFTGFGQWALPLEQALSRYDGASTSLEWVRDYGWLTIVAEKLSNRLGDLDALRGSGAFTEVAHLTMGGWWLLATPDWDDYGPAEAERVFEALAPVLPAGLPRPEPGVLSIPDTDPVERIYGNLIVPRDPRDITG